MLGSLERKIELLSAKHRHIHRQESILIIREGLEGRDLEKERKLLRLRHRRVHESMRRSLVSAGLEPNGRIRDRRFWKANLVLDLRTFEELHSALREKFQHLKNEQERASLSYEVFGKLEDIFKQRKKEGWERSAYFHLLALYNRYPNLNLLDFYYPEQPTRYSDRGWASKHKTEKGFFEMEALLAEEVLYQIEADRQRTREEDDPAVRSFSSCLYGLSPPLTWAEILFHSIESDTWVAKEELDDLFHTPRRYCMECDRTFLVAENNPGYFRCKRCSQNLRQRRHRDSASKCLKP